MAPLDAIRDDTEKLRAALSERALDLATELLGESTSRSGHQYRFGRKGSFSIEVSGSKAGLWRDHETGEGGDPFDLIQREKQCDFPAARQWACSWLGWSGSVPEEAPRRPKRDRAKEEAEERRRRNEAAQRAEWLWEASEPAPRGHLYLVSKGIPPGRARLCTHPDYPQWLLIDVRRPDGEHSTLEAISPEGRKQFLPGGAKRGCYATIQPKGRASPSDRVVICEGWATGMSIREATGLPVVAAMDAGNLLPVAEAIREKYPDAAIILAADNDPNDKKGVNPGVAAAVKAAQAVGGLIAVPDRVGEDWNDVHRGRGLQAVSEGLAAARSPDPEPTEPPPSDEPPFPDEIPDYGEPIHDVAATGADKGEKARKAPPRAPDMGITEDFLALTFAQRHGDELRFCHHTGSWFQWDGTRWRRDETQRAFHWSRRVCRDMNRTGAASLAKAATAAAVERFARADEVFAVTSDIWDRDKWLLGTPGGTVDLRTGLLSPATPEDYISKQTSVTPAAPGTPHPLWSKLLNDVTQGDKELERFLQQMAGYFLTGDVSEECLFFAYGVGGNGKGTFLGALGNIMGDYAVVADMATFTASKNDRHPTELAKLKGARLVTASETEAGRAWAESRIKELTGNERPISARFMRQDFFEFWPTFKLMFVGNHKPALRNVDEAARRRFNIIPFIHKPAVPDPTLKDRLPAEYPAILRWMIDGCLDWLRHRLVRPAAVVAATQTYFEEQDLLRQWVDDCCERGETKGETVAALFASWKKFAEANGEEPGSTKSFNQAMTRIGFEPVKNTPGQHGKRGFRGLSLVRQTVDDRSGPRDGPPDFDEDPRFGM